MNKKILILIFCFIMIISLINIKEKTNGNQHTNNTNTLNNTIERKDDMKLYIKVNNRTLTTTLENNSSASALIEKLEKQDITINMEDYANFEKVGALGFSLPRNDKQITTESGDIILYQGNQFVIYYDTNSWNFTKLGHIDNINQEELKQILGKGNVTVTLSLERK